MKQEQFKTLLNRIAEQEIPAHIDLWPTIRNRLSVPSKNLLIDYRKMGLALTAIMLIIFVMSAIWFGRVQPVSAAEILARSTTATLNPNAMGLQSYQGVIVGQMGDIDHGNLAQKQMYVWFQSPKKIRVEYYQSGTLHQAISTDKSGALSMPTLPLTANQLQVMSGSDGTNAWSLNPQRLVAGRYDPNEFAVTPWMFINPGPLDLDNNGGQSTDLPTILQNANRDYAEVKLAGDTMIAGRAVYVIELTPKSGNVYIHMGVAKIIVWVDKEFYLQIGYEFRSASGTVLDKSVFDSLTVNVPIDANTFTFTAPAEAKVYDLRPVSSPSASLAEQSKLWDQLAQHVSYKLFAPTEVPAHLESQGPVVANSALYYTTEGEYVTQHYLSAANIAALTISEVAGAKRPFNVVGTEVQQVAIGSYKGFYFEWGSQRLLQFERGGTIIALAGKSEISKDDLINIAASMQEVPTLETSGSMVATATPTQVQ